MIFKQLTKQREKSVFHGMNSAIWGEILYGGVKNNPLFLVIFGKSSKKNLLLYRVVPNNLFYDGRKDPGIFIRKE